MLAEGSIIMSATRHVRWTPAAGELIAERAAARTADDRDSALQGATCAIRGSSAGRNTARFDGSGSEPLPRYTKKRSSRRCNLIFIRRRSASAGFGQLLPPTRQPTSACYSLPTSLISAPATHCCQLSPLDHIRWTRFARRPPRYRRRAENPMTLEQHDYGHQYDGEHRDVSFPVCARRRGCPRRARCIKRLRGFRPDDTARAGSCRCSRRTSRGVGPIVDETQARTSHASLRSVLPYRNPRTGSSASDQHSAKICNPGPSATHGELTGRISRASDSDEKWVL